jgi:GNAT superfamily N-acetyltransferase
VEALAAPDRSVSETISMIRHAKKEEAKILTRLSIESKRYWRYPKEYIQIWNEELIITPEYIEKNDVIAFEDDGKIVGYYSIVELNDDVEISGIKIDKRYWLEHMFIFPDHIGQGIGTNLFDHLKKRCKKKGITELKILADPNSKGFYEKMGCRYQREYPSTIAGRTTPLLSMKIKNR